MKIIIETRSESLREKNEYKDRVGIEIDGEVMFDVHDGEHEDNNLGRNFNDVYHIGDMLERVYKAGKEGKELEIVYTENDEW